MIDRRPIVTVGDLVTILLLVAMTFWLLIREHRAQEAYDLCMRRGLERPECVADYQVVRFGLDHEKLK